jgi:hypothetical protein
MKRHLEKHMSAPTEVEYVKDFITRSTPDSISQLLTLMSDGKSPEFEAFFDEHVVELKPEQLVEEASSSSLDELLS